MSENPDTEVEERPKPRPRYRQFRAIREEEVEEEVEDDLILALHLSSHEWRPWARWGFDNAERLTPKGSKIHWEDLLEFVQRFGWLNEDFRSALNYHPCWMLHPDAVEVVTAIMLTRQTYESERETCGGRKHIEYFDAIAGLLEELRRIWNRWGGGHCEVKRYSNGGRFVEHADSDYEWSEWVANTVDVEWRGYPMPRRPLTATTARDELDDLGLDQIEQDQSLPRSDTHARGTNLSWGDTGTS